MHIYGYNEGNEGVENVQMANCFHDCFDRNRSCFHVSIHR